LKSCQEQIAFYRAECCFTFSIVALGEDNFSAKHRIAWPLKSQRSAYGVGLGGTPTLWETRPSVRWSGMGVQYSERTWPRINASFTRTSKKAGPTACVTGPVPVSSFTAGAPKTFVTLIKQSPTCRSIQRSHLECCDWGRKSINYNVASDPSDCTPPRFRPPLRHPPHRPCHPHPSARKVSECLDRVNEDSSRFDSVNSTVGNHTCIHFFF
jgi:hypothetical protein